MTDMTHMTRMTEPSGLQVSLSRCFGRLAPAGRQADEHLQAGLRGSAGLYTSIGLVRRAADEHQCADSPARLRSISGRFRTPSGFSFLSIPSANVLRARVCR